jgi:hypothetical protein
MMTRRHAEELQSQHGQMARDLQATKVRDLKDTYRRILEAGGMVLISGGPATRDELVSAILAERFPLEQLNQASHVLYHKAGERWSACDYCKQAGS